MRPTQVCRCCTCFPAPLISLQAHLFVCTEAEAGHVIAAYFHSVIDVYYTLLVERTVPMSRSIAVAAVCPTHG